ncbi:hypothetical protein HYW43_00330 [Candidatus Daviesbacteria bacterium]|nr:hypothetical protein [Candidatus Daviesbacteria bacterium]
MKKRCEASKNNYCSRSCAVTINNSKFPKRIALIKDCNFCAKNIPTYQLYCSIGCSAKGRSLSREEIINRIKRFYSNYGRVPLKREFWGIYKPARKYFGTWNKAIEAAGFKPNPIMFADNCIANDGHKCNSIAEKTIDDYLFQRDIVHERNIPYPKGLYTADFKIGKKLVEYFGLSGEHRRYDELKRIKKRIAKKYQLGLIEIYPKDLYPHNQLEKIFGY